jgi:hypothetical protein
VTTYKLVLAILVSLPNLNVIAVVKGVVIFAFGGILFNFFYYNYGSNYITKPYRKYYNRLINRLGI